MNRKIGYILLFIFLKTALSFSQHQTMDNTTKEILLQGKKTIIIYAFEILNEKQPSFNINPKDYEITVWANKTKVIVEFHRLIRYNPLNSGYLEYDITVDIIDKKVSPFEDWPKDSFYVPTKEELEKIEFVKTHGGIPIKGFDVGVREEKDSYWVGYSNESNHGGFSIDKITGERSDELQGHVIPPPPTKNQPINKDPLKEIFDTTTTDEILTIISTKISANPNDKFIEITGVLSVQEFEKIKSFVLKKGDRRTYRNIDSDNPHYKFNDFHVYLNSEIGQKNINNDPKLSDFNEITIHDWHKFDLQYYTIKIVRKGDIKNDQIYNIEEEMNEDSVYLLNRRAKDLNVMVKNLKEHYLVKLKDQINADR